MHVLVCVQTIELSKGEYSLEWAVAISERKSSDQSAVLICNPAFAHVVPENQLTQGEGENKIQALYWGRSSFVLKTGTFCPLQRWLLHDQTNLKPALRSYLTWDWFEHSVIFFPWYCYSWYDNKVWGSLRPSPTLPSNLQRNKRYTISQIFKLTSAQLTTLPNPYNTLK